MHGAWNLCRSHAYALKRYWLSYRGDCRQYLFMYLFIYLCIHLFIYLFIYLFIFLFGILVTLTICDFLIFNIFAFRFFLVIQKETDKNPQNHAVTITIVFHWLFLPKAKILRLEELTFLPVQRPYLQFILSTKCREFLLNVSRESIYIFSGVPRPKKVGGKVQNINSIRRNGFIEAAFTCFNLPF